MGSWVLFLGAVAVVLWSLAVPHASPGGPLVETRLMMDTLVSLKVWPRPGWPERATAAAIRAGFQAMDRVERMASFHRPDSELTALNRSPGPYIPGPGFRRLLERTDAVTRMTGGYFDPTFSVLQRAWGFYDQKGRIPDPDELRACLDRVGWTRLVTLGDQAVTLASGTVLDLGGIAGGFAIEEAIAALRRAGADTFFIDDGGDLWMEGRKPDGAPWRLAVRDPRGNGPLALVESATPIAISTSGDYERFVMAGDRRINHIFDPRSGQPAAAFQSVTVVASSPLLADIWSTALFAMPPEEARQMADREHLAALFLPASGPTWLSAAGPAWFLQVRP